VVDYRGKRRGRRVVQHPEDGNRERNEAMRLY